MIPGREWAPAFEPAAWLRDEDGQDLIEYGLLVALIALIALGAVGMVGQTINDVFWETIAGAF
jgi:Flp pilus assembly pilin Flp